MSAAPAPARDAQRLKATRTALWCGALVMSMTALAFASVPLYDLFCRMTGFGGTPMVRTEAASGTSRLKRASSTPASARP